ncbi:unnamed protein product [Adineta ricciae]|uniref:Uncharacterized protein n=1 Tax=Adineta ricciae TaxID=249248 RepID=A0A814GYT4_ADIRI|nr:unnamed protein product [Adineta ricciae]
MIDNLQRREVFSPVSTQVNIMSPKSNESSQSVVDEKTKQQPLMNNFQGRRTDQRIKIINEKVSVSSNQINGAHQTRRSRRFS